jgi:hypothetical protein
MRTQRQPQPAQGHLPGSRLCCYVGGTNITSLLGSNVITDVPRCLHLVGGGRVCCVHCVRGEEFAAADPQVRLLLAAVLQDPNVFAAVARLHTATRNI